MVKQIKRKIKVPKRKASGIKNVIKTAVTIPNRVKNALKGPKNAPTNSFQNFLNKEGSNKIRQIRIARTPVNPVVKQFVNVLSLGNLQKMQNKLGYKDIYHNYLLVQLDNGKWVRMDKDHVISDKPVDKKAFADSYDIPLNGKELTVNDMIHNASRGDKDFYLYNPRGNNCQNFTHEIITRNHLDDNIQDPKTKEVLNPQRSDLLMDSLPSETKFIPKLITDVAGSANRIVDGSGVHVYSADRRVSRCKGINRNGLRCKNKTAKTEYCYAHLRKNDGLRIGKSKIRGAKEGLFATKNFRRNENVTQYTGKRLTRAEKEASYSNYIFEPKKGVYIDAKLTNEEPGRWANDCKAHNKRARQCNGNNTKFSYNTRNRKAYLKATKPIKSGDEILVSYGREYWNS